MKIAAEYMDVNAGLTRSWQLGRRFGGWIQDRREQRPSATRLGRLVASVAFAQLLLHAQVAAAAVTLTALHSFDLEDGQGINGLVLGRDGNFYGTASGGGPGAELDIPVAGPYFE